MKKIAIILFISLLSWSSFSQHHEKREKIKALKVAFITERLALTETEAQKFWPIYNAYESKKDMHRRTSYNKQQQISKDMSEANAKILLNDLITLEKDRQNTRIEYNQNLLKVLPAKKIIKLRIAEDEFNMKMLEEYKKRQKDPTHKNP